jgi:hypothetical protein
LDVPVPVAVVLRVTVAEGLSVAVMDAVEDGVPVTEAVTRALTDGVEIGVLEPVEDMDTEDVVVVVGRARVLVGVLVPVEDGEGGMLLLVEPVIVRLDVAVLVNVPVPVAVVVSDAVTLDVAAEEADCVKEAEAEVG